MPVQSNLTLNTKVYTPRGTSNGISTWTLFGDSSFGGAQSDVTESVRGPLSNGTSRVRFTLTLPKTASEDSPCACIGQKVGYGKADVVIDVPTSFTAAERQDFVDRIQSLVASSVFDTSVANLEGSWG